MSEGKINESVGANLKTAAAGPVTAGGLLRQARQAQGLHIAALAAAIKVTPRKLESLESDHFDELPDATFTRGLAQAVCRTLKIDAAPVLALLPPQNGHRLEQVAEGLNTPFRERPGRLVPKDWASISSLLMGVAVVVLLATAAVYWWPAHLLPLARFAGSPSASEAGATVTRSVGADAAASDASGGLFPADSASATAGTSVTTVTTLPSTATGAPEPGADAASSGANAALAAEVARGAVPSAVAGAASAVQVSATNAESWVGVTDGRGQSLISRIVKPGESVIVDGVTPFKVTIGNAKGAKLVFRGTPTDLAPYTRDNVARIELK
ncbi:cytoskeleton protein RodZ [soil metagenome]